MAKQMNTHHDLQDRANRDAEAIPDWKAVLARNTKGADAANAAHVARQHEMGQRPSQNVRMVSPLFVGKKQADSVKDMLKPQVPSEKGRV